MEETPTTSPSTQAEIVVPPSGKRVFSLTYKRRILNQLDACSHLGEKSALLRREGLYSSYISKWRTQVANDDNPTTSKNKGGRPKLSKAERENRALRKENQRLKKQLERANLAMSVQKKLTELLESYSPETSDDDSNSKPLKNS